MNHKLINSLVKQVQPVQPVQKFQPPSDEEIATYLPSFLKELADKGDPNMTPENAIRWLIGTRVNTK